MNRWLTLCAVVIFILTTSVNLYNSTQTPIHENFRPYLLSELDKCVIHLHDLSFRKKSSTFKKSYLNARQHYKHIEFIVEYISPKEAKYYINGPLVPKHDADLGSNVFYPQGFHRIEEILYSGDSILPVELNSEVQKLITRLQSIREYYKTVELSDEQLLEMTQLELFRIATLGLNGYDASISFEGIRETYWAMEGLEQLLTFFKPYSDNNKALRLYYQDLINKFKLSKEVLYQNSDYNSFDRLNFIVDYINPLNEIIVSFHNATQLPWTDRKQALKLNNKSLFEEKNFNLQYFSIYYNDTTHNKQQAALGKLLFFDPALSKDNDMSCASCHNPSHGFSDGRRLSITKSTINNARNTPSLIDVIFQKSFFYDGRAYQLEQQVFDVVHNQNEMQSSFDEIVEKLKQSSEYKTLFKEAFMASQDQQISPYAIQKAITEYEKTLVSFDSPFDKFLKGDKSKLTKDAIDGYNLFAGKALCGSCHFFPVFNGAVPPTYNDSEFEVLGIPSFDNPKIIDNDQGRYNTTKVKEFIYAFKTPTVRNVALTSPYMHNGIYTSLEEVIDFYHKGGGKGMGFSIENQTLPFDSLNLTENEKKAIITFLHSLTDTTGTTSRPKRLPVFDGNSLLSNRKENY